MKILLAILACTLTSIAAAEEPWMYPVDLPPSPTAAEVSSAAMKESFAADANGNRPFECTARVVGANVATFQEIVEWYTEKIGETQLTKTLERFINQGKLGPEIGFFKTAPMTLSTHLTCRFMPEQKQVTILHAEANGHVVAISLLGLDRETSIQVIRHNPNPAPLARNDSEPEDARESPN